MMRSLYSGVSGLKVHQTRMDVIGNNIANVNTVGFKSQSVEFSELFYQTTQAASGPNAETAKGGQNAKQIGLGAGLSSISTNITGEGGTQNTGNLFDLKINGSSFFIVQNGGANYYTKAGNFTTDGFGNLTTPLGSYVMGYTAAKDPATGDFYLQSDELRPISIYADEYMSTDPAQTTEGTIIGNINSQDEKFEEVGYVTTTMYVYDSLGTKYGVQFKIENDPADTTKYTMSPMAVYRGTTKLTGVDAVLTGTAVTGNSTIPLEFSGTTGYLDMNVMAGSDFTLNIIDTNANANLESFQQNINVDFSTMKCFDGKTDLEATRGDKDNLGAGKAVGNMTELGIQDDGKIVASYDNGDTVTIGQVLVASFTNAAGLQKQGNNMFAETLNSGEAIVKDVSADGDTISGGVREMSNVDLADEFTNMIVTQRGYQANSRIITTSDTMLEELLSLKR